MVVCLRLYLCHTVWQLVVYISCGLSAVEINELLLLLLKTEDGYRKKCVLLSLRSRSAAPLSHSCHRWPYLPTLLRYLFIIRSASDAEHSHDIGYRSYRLSARLVDGEGEGRRQVINE